MTLQSFVERAIPAFQRTQTAYLEDQDINEARGRVMELLDTTVPDLQQQPGTYLDLVGDTADQLAQKPLSNDQLCSIADGLAYHLRQAGVL